jgi:hypothetical protein
MTTILTFSNSKPLISSTDPTSISWYMCQ